MNHHDPASTATLEQALQGTRRGQFFQELLTNSIHFPLANTFLEMLLSGPTKYLREADIYIIFFSCLVQAWFLSERRRTGRPAPLVGNLLGPGLYTLIEFAMEGMEFFDKPHHLAYWFFALGIGFFQWLGLQTRDGGSQLCILMENLIRTNILLVTYALFESASSAKYPSLDKFLSDPSHIFILLVLFFLGLVVGFANVLSQRYLETLQGVSRQLRRYSEWLLGPRLLAAAVAGEGVKSLQLTRRDRTILFMDIRGFTAWSEQRSPEVVVEMLNRYFGLGEQALTGLDVIKVKHTADEIMVVFPEPGEAIRAARRLGERTWPFLATQGLKAGAGLHRGEVIEGLIGSSEVKAYDVIGDTVNTAKRLCDNAPGGQILASEAVRERAAGDLEVNNALTIQAKGKSQPLTVYPVKLAPAGG
ncbi:MAG: adenylate/guanylate cyclase domain-containing protein [Magnetococcales bacterium]|nr:adenylate/guanylate cyclase domain-containing protein [Magnetococcales bacterium]